jgi:peptidyl-dipeptidase Dcp
MRVVLACVVLGLLAGCAATVQPTAPKPPVNPFFTEWTTPFGVPPFAEIKEEHYLPAFKEGIARRRAEVDAIVATPNAPSFANTIEALEGSGMLLAKVRPVFFALLDAESTPGMQELAKEIAPMMAAQRDDVFLNEALFGRVKAVWEQRDTIQLTPEQQTLLRNTYREFVRGGANLAAAQKERLRAINGELSVLTLKFSDNLLAETNAYRLVVERSEDLAGLPASSVAAAAEEAVTAGLPGTWVFTLKAPSIWPFLQYADNRELRRQIVTAYITRCDHGDAADNKGVLSRIVALRTGKANLLGFPTWADFVLDERMAKTPDRVYALLNQVWTPALAVAKKEAADLQAAIKAEGGDFALQPWDWRYYTEKVRKARYELDEEALRPYFKLDNVRDGAFTVANRLWGLTFVPRPDLPGYNPEVKAFEVRDRDGSTLGVLMTDYHPRASKRGGAWMDNFRDQWVKDGTDIRPVIYNVGNFSRPTGDTPALLSVEEAKTLFHEFGHALHGLLSRCRYRSTSGTAVYRDFVELPSQIMENWVLDPTVLPLYARHWKTGAPIPGELVAKLKKSEQFDQGFTTTEFVAAAFLDMDWHTRTDTTEVNTTEFERAALGRIGLIPEIVVRYRSPYFNHIFGGDYSAGYYSYNWAEVLDADAFQAFSEKGIFDQDTARSFRVNILERGGSEDPMELYKRFRGREPSVEPLLARRGLK